MTDAETIVNLEERLGDMLDELAEVTEKLREAESKLEVAQWAIDDIEKIAREHS